MASVYYVDTMRSLIPNCVSVLVLSSFFFFLLVFDTISELPAQCTRAFVFVLFCFVCLLLFLLLLLVVVVLLLSFCSFVFFQNICIFGISVKMTCLNSKRTVVCEVLSWCTVYVDMKIHNIRSPFICI